MKHFLLSLWPAVAAAAPLLLPALGLLTSALLWAAAHAAQLRGFTLLCNALVAVASLAYVGVKLGRLRRW